MSNVTDYWGANHISSNFGDARPNGRKHRGTDYTHGNGTPIPSPLAGTVVGVLVPSIRHGFGYQVTIRAASGETYSFAHMQSDSRYGVGSSVGVGDILGYEGRTGATTGPCTHVEYNNGGFSNPAPHVASLIAGGSVSAVTSSVGSAGFSQDTKNRQTWLATLGISVGASGADGIEGNATREGYKVYQRDLKANWGYAGLIDGDWGTGTQAAHQRKYDSMQKPTAPAFPLPAGSFFGPRSGPVASVSGYFSHGVDLARWQQQMKNRGWAIAVDGKYGDKTGDLAEAFQKEKGLTVDRLIGPATWAAAWTAPVT